MTRQVTRGRTHAAPLVAPLALIVALVVAITVVGLWHLTQGTSGLGMRELVLYAVGHPDAPQSVNGVPVDSVLSGSRVPRLLAGITVGFALGVAGILLQSVTRNQLASPDTLAVTAGSYVALTAVAAFGLTVPFWASGLVAFCGGLASAALVLSLTGAGSGRGGATGTTKLILAGSAIAMALDAVTGMLLILFKQNTTGLFAWGSGSLSQLSVDASARAVPVIVAVLLAAVLLSRRLDVLSLGDDDTATTLGVPVRAARANAGARGGTSTPAQARRRFLVVLVAAVVLLVAAVVYGLLAGSLWLRLGDIALWLRDAAPGLVGGALDTRAPRVTAAVLAGAALGVAGTVVQGTVRNPLAEPGLLGIIAGAGLGAVIATTMLPGSGRTVLVALAVTTGLATFALVAALSWRGGLLPDRFVLIGIGCGYGISSVTTFLLLRANPYDTPRIFTWLSGTTYGRTFPDVVPVAVVLLLTLPVLLAMRRQIDLMSVDEDTPRILDVPVERTRLGLLTLAAVLAAVSVVAVGVVGFVGLVAPHLARSLVGGRHGRVLPVAMVLGAAMVCLADGLGRSVIAPAQIPAGLMIALVGAPYFVWLLRRT